MLVEFDRPHLHDILGEDDGIGEESKIKINPAYVAAVFSSRQEGVTIVRLGDGRGFKVLGSVADVSEKLSQPATEVSMAS